MPLVKKWQLDEHVETRDAHFRKWAWADEQTWSRLYHVPFAFGTAGWDRLNNGNAVLMPSAGWDSQGVDMPSVVRYGATYYMAYGGFVTNTTYYRIGLAKSTNKINWSKSADNPIITNDQTWKNQRVWMPALIIDHKAGLFKMWYAGVSTTPTNGVGYAYCPLTADPMVKANWTDYAGNPVISFSGNRGGCFGVLRLGNLYYLMCSDAATTLHLYCSRDGINWTYICQLLGLGASGEWDDANIYYATLFWCLGNFYILYSGYDGTTNYKIGMAVASRDGRDYVRLMNNLANPVLGFGGAGKFDYNLVYSPSLMMEDKSFCMWYSGGLGSVYAIGLAKVDLDY